MDNGDMLGVEKFLWEEAHKSLDGCGVYGDWLEEHGRVDDAHCWRWIYSHKKEPVMRNEYNRYGNRIPAPYRWAWFSEIIDKDDAIVIIPSHARLSYMIMFQLSYAGHVYLPSRHSAIEALRLQLLRVWNLLKCDNGDVILSKPVGGQMGVMGE